jgi:hypothetical protein
MRSTVCGRRTKIRTSRQAFNRAVGDLRLRDVGEDLDWPETPI